MDVEPRPRDGRPSARRLKDISHLYISAARRPAVPNGVATRVATPRRALRIAVAGPANVAARVELVANLALQFARLGRRTVVVDLDPALPNAGFRLALDPPAYLGHLAPDPSVRCERGLLGVRLVEGAANGASPGQWPAGVLEELAVADCVLVSQGEPAAAREALRSIAGALPGPVVATTLSRAAAQSPMIGAWLATSRRPRSDRSPAADAIEAVLWVVDAGAALPGGIPVASVLADLSVRSVVWGAAEGTSLEAWARVPWHPLSRLPIAALEPDHPLARLFEGLAQSLLAGFGAAGGPHA